MVPVEVEDVVKEVSELVQLEVGEELLAHRRGLRLLLGPADEGAPGVLRPPALPFPLSFNNILVSAKL